MRRADAVGYAKLASRGFGSKGPIGLLLTFLARREGATVFSSDPLAFRRKMSIRFGAEMCFDAATSDPEAEVREYRSGIGADVRNR